MLQRACAEVRYNILHILGISIIVSHNAIVLSHKKPPSADTSLISCRSEENDKRENPYYKDQLLCCTFAYTAEHYSPKCSSVFMTIQLQLAYFQ